ncbi:Uncharacterised protein [uncultured archaeon]|nr:Uncharacterised protein [uncultured archaeon]
MAGTRLFIPERHISPIMGGTTELSDIARKLSTKFKIPKVNGAYQGDVYNLVHENASEYFLENLRYEDKVCTATFEHLHDGVRHVQYQVLFNYLDGQLKMLGKTPPRLRILISGDLRAIQKTAQSNTSKVVANIVIPDFSEVEEFIAKHILYQGC